MVIQVNTLTLEGTEDFQNLLALYIMLSLASELRCLKKDLQVNAHKGPKVHILLSNQLLS